MSGWSQLPRELTVLIASCLTHNGRACTLRLISKAAAEQFRGREHTAVRLSQPVPEHAFARKWGAPGTLRGLPNRLQLQLLCLTATSGVIPNMEVALAATGCPPTKKVLEAAAAAGQVEMCEWLLQRGCPCHGALEAAAAAGQQRMCEWLIANGHAHRLSEAPIAAARGGHVGLMDWLLQTYPDRCGLPVMAEAGMRWLAAAAKACDLATLQRLHRDMEALRQAMGLPMQEEVDGFPVPNMMWFVTDSSMDGVLAAAAASPTPDWRAKVEWLEEGLHYNQTPAACAGVMACADVLKRLAWLRQRGYPLGHPSAVSAAGRAGNLATLQYLHAEGIPLRGAAFFAARAGHREVVAWLLDTPGTGAQLDADLFNAAAESGSLELLAWLRHRGCPWDAETFAASARGGNGAALEWLAERGCPMGEGKPYFGAACNEDAAAVHCLSRLGCPWGPPGALFRRLVYGSVGRRPLPLAFLRQLLLAGCPVDLAEAAKEARRSDLEDLEGFLAMLAEERERREGQQRAGQGQQSEGKRERERGNSGGERHVGKRARRT